MRHSGLYSHSSKSFGQNYGKVAGCSDLRIAIDLGGAMIYRWVL